MKRYQSFSGRSNDTFRNYSALMSGYIIQSIAHFEHGRKKEAGDKIAEMLTNLKYDNNKRLLLSEIKRNLDRRTKDLEDEKERLHRRLDGSTTDLHTRMFQKNLTQIQSKLQTHAHYMDFVELTLTRVAPNLRSEMTQDHDFQTLIDAVMELNHKVATLERQARF